MKFKKRYLFWPLLLLILLVFLGYQNTFVSHHKAGESFVNPLSENETILVSIKDHNFSLRKTEFDPLTDSLKFWEHNPKTGDVYVKEQSLLPSKFTPLLFVYNRGNDSFEKQENVLPVSTFPYFIHQNEFQLDVIDIGENGELFFEFQNRKLSIEPGQSYRTFFFDGIKIRSITIQNFGIKQLEQFKLFPEIEEEMEKEEERRKIEEELLEETSE